MSKLLPALGLAAGLCVASLSTQAAPGRYLVVFKADTLPADAAARVTGKGGNLARAFQQIGVVSVTGDAAFAARMAKDPSVLSVGPELAFAAPETLLTPLSETDANVEAAPTAADNLYAAYQWDMRRMGAPAVWARLPVAATAPRVAVLDTGVMDDHPDLVGQVDTRVSTSYCNTAGGANGSASYPIYASLIDFDVNPDVCTPVAPNYQTHGTHVAGTIAAKFGGGRVVGLAPDAKIGAYKVFDRLRYTDATGTHDVVSGFDGPIFAAIIQATQAGYGVISMSLGSHIEHAGKDGAASWHAWDRVAKWANRAGVVIVSSAGNDAVNANGKMAHIPSDLPTVVNVSATGSSNLVVSGGVLKAAPGSDVLAFYSNYGAAVDVAAPGGDCGPNESVCQAPYLILNTIIQSNGTPWYGFLAGTSMATPHVSAVAAYVRSIHPGWSPGEVRSWLKTTAQPIGSRQAFGAGMVDADAAAR
ncbi:S8 family peptidase [Lysobacter fragariae]